MHPVRNISVNLATTIEKPRNTYGEFINEENALDLANDYPCANFSPFITQIQSAAGSIDRSISSLHRLSNAIRFAAAESRNIRAVTYEWRDCHGTDLSRVFLKEEVLPFLKFRFARLRGRVRDRLAMTMAVRRKRLLYRQQHQLKLESKQIVKTKEEPPIPEEDPGLLLAEEIPEAKQEEPKEPAAPSQITGMTTPTTHHPERFRKAFARSRISRVEAPSLRQQTKDRFPLAPKPVKGSKSVLCSFCCLWIPLEDIRSRNDWM